MKELYSDGELTDNELIVLEQKRIDARQDNQKRMAWVAIVSMIVYTIALFMPFVNDGRAQILTDIASLFYVAQAGVVGAYMGSEALVNRTRTSISKTITTERSGPPTPGR
jgi:hypothetical protein